MISILKYGAFMYLILLILRIPVSFSLMPNTLYVEDQSSNLYAINITTGSATLIGSIGISDVTDIAFDGFSLYGITFDIFISIDPDTGEGATIGNLELSDLMNALVVDRGGIVYSAGVVNGDFVRINPSTGIGTVIGNYGEGITSSGDLTFDSNGVLYASVKQSDPNTGEPLPNDRLAKINLATGRATLIGNIGFEDVFGLSFRNGTLYGVTAFGQVLIIDTSSGAGTLVGVNGVTQWGASTSPREAPSYTINFTTFIPGNHLDSGLPCKTTTRPPEIAFPLYVRTDGIERGFDPEATTFRTRQLVTVIPDESADADGIKEGTVFEDLAHPTKLYAPDALPIIDDSDDDEEGDCHLLHEVVPPIKDMHLTVDRVGPNTVLVRLFGHAGTGVPTNLLRPCPISWDFSLHVDTSGDTPTVAFTAAHDGFPAYELHINDQLVYSYPIEPLDDLSFKDVVIRMRKLCGSLDVTMEDIVELFD